MEIGRSNQHVTATEKAQHTGAQQAHAKDVAVTCSCQDLQVKAFSAVSLNCLVTQHT